MAGKGAGDGRGPDDVLCLMPLLRPVTFPPGLEHHPNIKRGLCIPGDGNGTTPLAIQGLCVLTCPSFLSSCFSANAQQRMRAATSPVPVHLFQKCIPPSFVVSSMAGAAIVVAGLAPITCLPSNNTTDGATIGRRIGGTVVACNFLWARHERNNTGVDTNTRISPSDVLL